MMAQIEQALPPGNKVTYTGHSLGGALANLAAAEHQGEKGKVEVVTFGAPRVGDKAFAATLESKLGQEKITRVTTPGDPITQVPPSASVVGDKLGFQHAGKPNVLDKKGNLRQSKKERPVIDFIQTASAALTDPKLIKDYIELGNVQDEEQKKAIIKDVGKHLVEASKANHSSYLQVMNREVPTPENEMDLKMKALAALANPNMGNTALTESSNAGTALASVRESARPTQVGSGAAQTTEAGRG